MTRVLPALFLLAVASAAHAEITPAELDRAASALQPRVIEWRRDFHRHPELANREFRTSARVAEHLRSLGLEVRTGIAHTGVAAVIEGGRPGPTILLRADMDGLPVTERTDVPFRSVATGEFRGQTVGVMHACGHDGHMAILMGAAEILVRMRDRLPGRILLVFQPAEEGAPDGERGGAPLMIEEGLLDIAKPEAAFGLHLMSSLNTGTIGLRAGPFMAGSDFFQITVTGRQSHGSRPWNSVDPVVVASEIVGALQTIVSRELDITKQPAVITVGAFRAGVRHNIIPQSAELLGTIRTFSPEMRAQVIDRIGALATGIAAAHGATAEFTTAPHPNPVLVNDPSLTARVLPSLEAVVGRDNVRTTTLQTVAEDFAHIAQAVPSVYYFVGITPKGQDPATAPDNHADLFYVDEDGIAVGLRSLLHVAVDYLSTRASEQTTKGN
ncbi:MAG: amidohydrolase [Steroidobacteraceae bacterium]|nr:amidohydrolase [Steroidobacteraceae bacterium]